MRVSKRRTRREKENVRVKLAQSVQAVVRVVPFTFEGSASPVVRGPETGILGEIPEIKKDLLKTLLVIVLALASELGVYLMMQKGGR